MDVKSVFNLAVCVFGIALLLIHIVDLILKKGKRIDEKYLLYFFIFTLIHFATYLTFTLIKSVYTSNTLITCFYTIFYIMNNIEVLFFVLYSVVYITTSKKSRDIIYLINLIAFSAMIILDLVNIHTHFFFEAINGQYVRTKFMILSQLYQFIGFAIILLHIIFIKKLNRTEKIAFILYCLLPIVAIIVQNLLSGYAIAYLSIIISIEILFLFVNVKKNILLEREAKVVKEAEVKIMMSQIQPHFIYNTLASISTLIQIDPDKAQEALDVFTEYLRSNLSALSDIKLVPFKDELRHIETYLSLEKLRFGDRLKVIHDIRVRDFMVPPLSLQPIVENAVKHGILKKIEGGTLTIKTYEDDINIYVEIIDDGVGFDVNDKKLDEIKHVGLRNVKYRLNSMCEASLNIRSEIDRGTDVLITFKK